jgi:class 3 adenylate cyclase
MWDTQTLPFVIAPEEANFERFDLPPNASLPPSGMTRLPLRPYANPVTACPACEAENPDRARFCLECGTQLVASPAEVRKMVTVVFTDIVGSTSLGERLDPEAFKGVLTEYFRRMRKALERHGGLLEKYIGDAMLGVFGIPHLHEDDALRAVRAAVEMRAALHELNIELLDTYGIAIQSRTGVNTGEVIQGDISQRQTLVFGDTVNIAARLEQAAGPNEILIGKTTFHLTRQAVSAEPVEELVLKGKREPLTAYRLESVADVWGRAPRAGSTLVGRTGELAALQASFARASEQRKCERVTVIGPAGVGKSRLVEEFVVQLGPTATVVKGRCLPYGDKITYWPLRELIRDAIGAVESDSAEVSREKLTYFLAPINEGPLVGELLGQVLGLRSAGARPDEIAWAVRWFLEVLARPRPAVLVLDDVQWADPVLIEFLSEAQIRSVGPMLFLYLVRLDADDDASDWLIENHAGSSIVLESLAEDYAYALVEDVLGGHLSRDASSRIVQKADGNALFIEELLLMLIDQGRLLRTNEHWRLADGVDRIELPPTIRALLAARLDRLETNERSVVDTAAVIGKIFPAAAVENLVDERTRQRVDVLLQQLVTKGLMQEDSVEPDGKVFRFRHLLIQDVAYDSMSKRRRAELHESFARWLQTNAADRADEYEELVGYHLEQVYHYRAELGALRDSRRLLGEEAASWLSAAARRVLALGAPASAARLLRRSSNLLSDQGPARLDVLLDLGEALLQTGDLVEAGKAIAKAESEASAAANQNAKARARMLSLLRQFQFDAEQASVLISRESPELLRTFDDAGDQLGLARTWRLLANIEILHCRFGRAAGNFQRAADHANASGNWREECDNLAWLVIASVWGPTSVTSALTTCTDVYARAGHDLTLQITTLLGSAILQAMLGFPEKARSLSQRAKSLLTDLGPTMFTEVTKGQACAYVEMYAGAASAAEREALESYRFLDELGNRVWLSSLAAMLAQATYAQNRWTEAEAYMEISALAAAPDDLDAQVRWRGVGARLSARTGNLAEADRLAGEALRFAEMTDFLDLHADSLVVRAEVLMLQTRRTESAAALAAALALYERKGNVVSAAEVRRLLNELEAGATTLRTLLPIARC